MPSSVAADAPPWRRGPHAPTGVESRAVARSVAAPKARMSPRMSPKINNRSGKPTVSQESLRQRLLRDIQGSGIEAVALNGTSAAELEAEAKAKQCDYILYSDVAALKMSKLGGLFGSVTGAGGLGKTEAKMEFKLFAVGETSPRLQSSSSAKEEGDENSAGVAIDAEARMVVAEVKKRRG